MVKFLSCPTSDLVPWRGTSQSPPVHGRLLCTTYVRLGTSSVAYADPGLQFEKIFVVGLPARTDRRDGMVLQAALSNMEIEFIDGVAGGEVPDKAIPMNKGQKRLKDASIGSWRAHMNAIQE